MGKPMDAKMKKGDESPNPEDKSVEAALVEAATDCIEPVLLTEVPEDLTAPVEEAPAEVKAPKVEESAPVEASEAKDAAVSEEETQQTLTSMVAHQVATSSNE